jgi:ribosomal protein L11 methyltransferase
MGASVESSWIDVQVRTSLDAGEVLGALNDPSVTGGWLDADGTIHFYWPAAEWTGERLAHLRTILLRLGDGQAIDSVEIREEPEQDWNRVWAQSVKPLRIGRRVLIRPSWESGDGEPGTIELVIDPQLAFGTGHHATTSMLIEWIEDLVGSGMSVLDVGTGTGILAMVALRCGAIRAVGLDCDPQAIEYAKGYAAQNGFDEETLRLIGGYLGKELVETSDPWQLVLANLDCRTLLEAKEPLARLAQRGATLLLSGILVDQEEEIRRAYAESGIYVAEVRRKDGWVALRAHASESCDGRS